MKLTRWRTTAKKAPVVHVTADGIKTGCGVLIPERAMLTRDASEWYLHTTCYNCTHRLWPLHGPADYICPANSRDFPPRKKCPHGRDSRYCVRCTPSAARNWPCPNGCTDPVDHDPLRGSPTCTVYPPRLAPGSDGRCIDGCESTDAAIHRANPKMYFDLADSAMMTCYHCGNLLELWA